MKKFFLYSMLSLFMFSCSSNDTDAQTLTPTQPTKPEAKYQTKNVVLLVVDGPRISETWEAASKENIPNRVSLLNQGVFISNFKNNGTTNTNPGHSAMCSGVYENIKNNGTELPGFPSVMQQWLKFTGADKTKAWVIASKDKLEVLNDCKLADWKGKYQPSVDCGVSGNGSGYRDDLVTMTKTKEVMAKYSPNVMVINLKDVDSYGHANKWDEYIKAIKTTDASIKEIWDYIQSLPAYKDKTTLIVSNDHGRHIDAKGGFAEHGDDCAGCRHIEFFAMGPDFKKNATISTGNYEQIDIASTMAELLGVPAQYMKGKIIKDAFK
ncbi:MULTISPECIES: alkaline phosphatase family protein [unclassified Chryseobacterium]|uniref:alkaline phosphatase family protein n=1 Tax=unclassified Chryseobacterium TaxID=2593645 RepID=UPI00100A6462|nr:MULTISPECIES: alkaline phosphatase family protein [unclassified Chryseobacterium]RXM51949.1 sulfatase [Chryseobacterium sp. CH25]RXM63868.1 sulfatase [Chryseobacterium sp. CH1]